MAIALIIFFMINEYPENQIKQAFHTSEFVLFRKTNRKSIKSPFSALPDLLFFERRLSIIAINFSFISSALKFKKELDKRELN